MFKGPVGPQSGRTPRSQAEKMGTEAGGFKEDPPYDVMSGCPITAACPAQEYKPTPMKAPVGGSSTNIPAPFSITGK